MLSVGCRRFKRSLCLRAGRAALPQHIAENLRFSVTRTLNETNAARLSLAALSFGCLVGKAEPFRTVRRRSREHLALSYEINPRFFIKASTFGSRPRKLR